MGDRGDGKEMWERKEGEDADQELIGQGGEEVGTPPFPKKGGYRGPGCGCGCAESGSFGRWARSDVIGRGGRRSLAFSWHCSARGLLPTDDYE